MAAGASRRSANLGAVVDELVEVLDERGAVVDVVPRASVRARNLWHRSVYVAVVHRGAVLAHQRAGWKDVWPSRWDVAFGGVCGVGERFSDAALRELAEEAGVAAGEHELLDLGEDRFEDDHVRVLGRLYAIDCAGPFTFADGEVVASEWVRLDGLRSWLGQRDVVPDSAAMVVPRLLA